jgi:hypothetical protein
MSKLLDSIMNAPGFWAEEIKVAPPVVTAIGVAFASWQFRINQSWKRMEYAATLVRRANEDETLALAILCLDWRSRLLPIPERYKNLADEINIKHIKHSYAKMAGAFSIDNRQTIPETNQLELTKTTDELIDVLYVDILEYLFQYLEEVNKFVETGLIRRRDVLILTYWADRIINLKNDGEYVFRDYLVHYKIRGVFGISSHPRLYFAHERLMRIRQEAYSERQVLDGPRPNAH